MDVTGVTQPAATLESTRPAPDADAATSAIMVAVDGGPADPVSEVAASVEARLRRDFGSRPVSVLLTDRGTRGVRLVTIGERSAGANAMVPSFGSISAGGIPGPESALPALLRKADELGAEAVALIAGEVHDGSVDWLRLLFDPILDGSLDYVCPAYRRHKLDGLLVTGVVYPLTRALFGLRLRQPLGGEAAISLRLARRLLADDDWEMDPGSAGADTWLTAKVLTGEHRVGQAWLGTRARRAADHDEPSHILARILGQLFREMERHAAVWQQVAGSKPVPAFGNAGLIEDEAPHVNVDGMVGAFRQGLRDLQPVWARALSPTTLLALRRASQAPAESFRLEDALWVRVVYDFAVAHVSRALERTQLLLSMTPLYLAWVASFVNEAQSLNGAAVEERVEQLCQVFERDKPYLIGRWRWPDRFSP